MGGCFCTGACMRGFPCAANPHGSPVAYPAYQQTIRVDALPEGSAEDFRKIVREEIERALDER